MKTRSCPKCQYDLSAWKLMLAGRYVPVVCGNCGAKVYPRLLVLGVTGALLNLILIAFLLGALYYKSWFILILFVILSFGIFMLIGLFSPLSYKEKQ